MCLVVSSVIEACEWLCMELIKLKPPVLDTWEDRYQLVLAGRQTGVLGFNSEKLQTHTHAQLAEDCYLPLPSWMEIGSDGGLKLLLIFFSVFKGRSVCLFLHWSLSCQTRGTLCCGLCSYNWRITHQATSGLQSFFLREAIFPGNCFQMSSMSSVSAI